MEGIELPNQERIRTHGEKGVYKLFGILKMETIKQVEKKEKLKRRVSHIKEKTSRNQSNFI